MVAGQRSEPRPTGRALWKGWEYVMGDRRTIEPARTPEYLFALPDGRFIYVSVETDASDYYESFRLFIGDGKVMRDVPVTSVERFRDGGTTYVETAEGVLFSPSRHKGGKPAWGDDECEQELIELDPRHFVIVETAAGVTIEPR
jgi:hypothetical protein